MRTKASSRRRITYRFYNLVRMYDRLLDGGFHPDHFWMIENVSQSFVGQSNSQALVIMNSLHSKLMFLTIS